MSGAQGPPQFLKERSDAWANEIFHMGSHQFRASLGELLRELWFSHCSSREMPFREWDFSFRELFFELRELLREYPGTLPELREWPFHSESVFPEIGVVPRLLKIPIAEILCDTSSAVKDCSQRLAMRDLGALS